MKGSAPAKKKLTFSLSAPTAQSVELAGSFTGWASTPVPLKRQKNGSWKATLSLAPGTYRYRFLVDGEWQDDPSCATREPNPFGTEDCVFTVS